MNLARQVAWLVRAGGLRAVLGMLFYTGWKTMLDQPFAPRRNHTWRGFGAVIGATPHARGASFNLVHGNLDISFLTPDLVRVSWGPAKPLPPYALAREEGYWDSVGVTVDQIEGDWVVSSAALKVQVHPADAAVSFVSLGGILLRKERPPRKSGNSVSHQVELRPNERVFGLGERACSLNLRGRAYQLWNQDPGGSYGRGRDPLYLSVPAWISVHEGGSYLVFYENFYRGWVNLGQRDPDLAEVTFDGGTLRYYVTVGDLPAILARYTELTGRPPMPPMWALGYHQSRWGYANENKICEVITGFERHQILISAIHLDTDYMDQYGAFTVNRRRFPELPRLASELEERGVQIVAILDPGVRIDRHFPLYRDGLAKNMFAKLPDRKLSRAPVWPGWCAFPDFTDPKVREWWGSQYSKLLNEGVSGFWHDMNEPAAFVVVGDPTLPLATRHSLEGQGGDHLEAHNVYGLLMAQAGYRALTKARPTKRPFILSRSGWAGLQRYAWTWTGDVESTWDALTLTISTVLGLGLSGMPFCGPDVGGFSGAPSAELYLRWLQLSAFLPFFRTHSAVDTPEREPWSFNEPYTTWARNTIRLRYALMPYIYTLAWEAHVHGWPLVRPLFWLGREDPELLEVEDAFLLGESLLVAPVLKEGAQSREVRLPKGLWYDFWNDVSFEGPGSVCLEAPLERTPLLVHAGKVIPMVPPQEVAALKIPFSRLYLHLYPPPSGEEGVSFIYTDAGEGYGPFRIDRFRFSRKGNFLELFWSTEGEYPLPYQKLVLVLHGFELKTVKVDGARVPVKDNSFQIPQSFTHAVLKIQ